MKGKKCRLQKNTSILCAGRLNDTARCTAARCSASIWRTWTKSRFFLCATTRFLWKNFRKQSRLWRNSTRNADFLTTAQRSILSSTLKTANFWTKWFRCLKKSRQFRRRGRNKLILCKILRIILYKWLQNAFLIWRRIMVTFARNEIVSSTQFVRTFATFLNQIN